MRLEHLKLRAQPFHMRGRPSKFVRYASQQGASRFIQNVLDSRGSIGLLYGPELSGKSVLIHRFFQEMPHDLTVATVDGRGLNATQILSSILTQFGYDTKLSSTNELLNMLNIIVVHQTRANQAPVLVVDSIGDMYPSALAALCKLASFSNQGRFALRILFVGRNPIRRILKSPKMSNIAKRFVGSYEMESLTSKEALLYLYAKARSVGINCT
jgi:type II secretory pathway predicted ATPase ExeA